MQAFRALTSASPKTLLSQKSKAFRINKMEEGLHGA
jgi:hypothetical protein